jgi:hypothetical protein
MFVLSFRAERHEVLSPKKNQGRAVEKSRGPVLGRTALGSSPLSLSHCSLARAMDMVTEKSFEAQMLAAWVELPDAAM